MEPIRIGKHVVTLNLTPGQTVYGEKLISKEGKEYRIWDPFRSKLAAAIHNGLKDIPLEKDSNVLYLGASTGTTASHVSDLIPDGIVVCVDFAPECMKKLLLLCESRPNMIPVLADANKPNEYTEFMAQGADLIYQDVAQPNQAEILIKNARKYLKEGMYAIIAIKARSVDVTKDPESIFRSQINELKSCFEILQEIYLTPFDKDHKLVVCRKVKE
jgi:fibrillarin-like pre-rRNA processing protein